MTLVGGCKARRLVRMCEITVAALRWGHRGWREVGRGGEKTTRMVVDVGETVSRRSWKDSGFLG